MVFEMLCAVCRARIIEPAEHCPECRARFDPREHDRVRELQFLVRRLQSWYDAGRLTTAQYFALKRETRGELEDLTRSLRWIPPPPEEEVIEEDIIVIDEPPPVARRRPRPAAVITPLPPPEPEPEPEPEPGPKPEPEPEPVAKPRDFFKNLASPRNITWLLNLGIFIFSAGLAVFIYTEWENIDKVWQTLILFGGTGAVLLTGHFMRNTLLSVTGRGLIALGTIALPIDFFALARAEIFPMFSPAQIGLAACVTCVGVYTYFARLYKDRRFSFLALIAVTGIWIFGLRLFGVGWGITAATLPPFFLACYVAYHFFLGRGRTAETERRLWIEPTFAFLHAALAAATGWIAVACIPAIGHLQLDADFVLIVIALASGFGFYFFSAWRVQKPVMAYCGLPFLLAGFAELVYGLEVPLHDVGRWMVYFGIILATPLGLRRVEQLRGIIVPLVGTGASAIAIGLAWSAGAYATTGDALDSLISSLVAAGLFCMAASLATRSRLAAAFGLPMLAAAGHFTLVLAHRPMVEFAPYYGLFGAAVGGGLLAVRKRFDFLIEPATWVASAAGCVAMVLLVAPGLRLDFFKHYQLLGLLTSAGAAVAFFCATTIKRSRFMSDIAYFAVGGAYVFGLKMLGVDAQWMGIAGVALAAAFFVLAEKVKGIFMRPSFFVAIATAIGAVVYGIALYIEQNTLFASLTMLSVAIYFAVTQFTTRHKYFGYPAVLLLFVAYAWFAQYAGVLTHPALRGAVALGAAVLVGSAVARRFGREAEAFHLDLMSMLMLGAAGIVTAAQTGGADAYTVVPILLLMIAHQGFLPGNKELLAARSALVGLCVAFVTTMMLTGPRPGDAAMTMLAAAAYFALAQFTTPHKLFGHPAVLLTAIGYVWLMQHFEVVEPEFLMRGGVLLVGAVLGLSALARRRGRTGEALHIDLMSIMLLASLAVVTAVRPEGADVLTLAPIVFLLILHQAALPRDPMLLPVRPIPVAVCAISAIAILLDGCKPAESSLIFVLIAAYSGLVARIPRLSGAAYPAVFALAAAYFGLLNGVPTHWIGLAFAPVCIAGILSRGRRASHTALASAIVLFVVTLGLLGDPRIWSLENQHLLPPSIMMAVIVAGFATALSVPKLALRDVPVQIPTAFAAGYLALAHCLMLRAISKGSIYGGPSIMIIAFALVAIATLLHRRGMKDHAVSPLSVGVLMSAVAVIYGFGDWPAPVFGWTLMSAGVLYWLVSITRRTPAFVYGSVAAIGVGTFFLAQSYDFDPSLTGFFMIPTSVATVVMGWDLARRFGREYGAPMALAGMVIAATATLIVSMNPLALALHLAYDAILLAFVGTVGRMRRALYFSSVALLGSFASMMHHAGMSLQQGVAAMLGITILQMLATSRAGERHRPYTDPFFGLALVAGLVTLAVGGFDSSLYLNPQDTAWGILALSLSTVLYGGAAWVRRQPALGYFAGASAFFAYSLTCHYFKLHEVEFYTIPLGLAVLVWSYTIMRHRVQKAMVTVLDLVGMGLLVLPSVFQSFDQAADPNTLVVLATTLLLVFAGMAMHRRIYLLSGSFVFVAEVMAKGVQYLVESHAAWSVWALVTGVLLILVAAAVERIARGKATALKLAAGQYFADWD